MSDSGLKLYLNLAPWRRFRTQAQEEAAVKQWSYEEFPGSTVLFRRLLGGDWNSDFLIVPPHHQIAATYDDDIVRADAAG